MNVAAVTKDHQLDLSNRTVEQTLAGRAADLQAKKFVRLEVDEAVNPDRIPVSFTVQFQPPRGQRVQLGNFALYPPDKPAKFIVATQGLLQPGGTLIVSLTAHRQVSKGDVVRIRLKPMTLVDE